MPFFKAFKTALDGKPWKTSVVRGSSEASNVVAFRFRQRRISLASKTALSLCWFTVSWSRVPLSGASYSCQTRTACNTVLRYASLHVFGVKNISISQAKGRYKSNHMIHRQLRVE